MDWEGVTDCEPESAIAPRLLSSEPEVAFCDVQVSVVLWPAVMDEGETESVQVGGADPTEQDAYWYEPESDPLVHALDCETHWYPNKTLDVWYAVTSAPFWIVWLLKEQDAGVPPPPPLPPPPPPPVGIGIEMGVEVAIGGGELGLIAAITALVCGPTAP